MSFTSTEPVLHVASVDEPVLHVPRAGSEINVAGPSVGSETNVAGLTLDREACEVQSPPSGTSVHGSGKKRKKSQVASVLDDYLEHKKNQTDNIVEAFLEKKTRGEESMDRCIHIFEAMEDLTDEEKAIAGEVFENELYWEMFLKLTIHNVRLIWLRRKIRYASHLSKPIGKSQYGLCNVFPTRSLVQV
ncbi:hypothetical protein ZEAMMB73_Zm00001d008958 [Zea mays]|uniref:Uncharacterized protein n=1 Tax=Zea mays TaxID=4577 RepID=A0A1D6FGV9_MAIZE|nr:hypothetical protein ZEAMMB73_Zm00001d008958 [Zea mays]